MRTGLFLMLKRVSLASLREGATRKNRLDFRLGLCPRPHPRGAPIMCAKRAHYREGALPPSPPTPCRRGYKVRYGAHLLRRRRCLLEPPTPFRRGPKGRCPSGLQRPARSVKSWGKDPHALTSLARRDTLSHYIFLSSYGIKKTMCSVYPF